MTNPVSISPPARSLPALKHLIGSKRRLAVALLIFTGLLCLIEVVFVPGVIVLTPSAHDRQLHQTPALILCSPLLRRSFLWLYPIGLLILYATSAAVLWCKRFRAGIILLGLSVCACPVSFLQAVAENYGRWFVRDCVLAPDGRQYYLLEVGDVDHDTRTIARTRTSGFFFDSVDLLDPDCHYYNIGAMRIVIPPTPPPCSHGLLYATSKYVVGLSEGDTAYIVFDLSRNHYYTQEEVITLSPSLLLDDETPANTLPNR
jgi:hypothetical protein